MPNSELTESQEAAFQELNSAFMSVQRKYGVGSAEYAVSALMEARWVMNTIIKSPYADLIAEKLAATNYAVNYMQRVMARADVTEDDEIDLLIEFGVPSNRVDKPQLATIVKDRRKLMAATPSEKWPIRDYRVDTADEDE